jgi:hypothetical protein
MPVFRTSLIFAAAALLNTGAVLAQTVDAKDLSVQQQAVAAIVAPDPSLEVAAWVDHENNRYALGEAIQLFVKVNEDAYITVVSVGPSGRAVQLYPNAFQPGELIEGGETLQIPGDDAAAQIVVQAPAGNELIKVIASTAPLQVTDTASLVMNGAFPTIEGGSEQFARDLAVAVTEAPQVAFYDKVIKTSGTAEIEGASATAVAKPLIATDATDYGVGDTVQLAVTAIDDCNLWVVNLSQDESAHLLFPNKLMRENAVDAGKTVLISGGDSLIKVQVAGPAGDEEIYAFCTDVSFADTGLDFSQTFPEIGRDTELGKALVAVDASESGETISPDIYSWSMVTVTVAD